MTRAPLAAAAFAALGLSTCSPAPPVVSPLPSVVSSEALTQGAQPKQRTQAIVSAQTDDHHSNTLSALRIPLTHPKTQHPAIANALETAKIAIARRRAQKKILGPEYIEEERGTPKEPSAPSRPDLQHLVRRENGNALGTVVSLESPAGALSNFYAALRSLNRRRKSYNKVRVLAFGASHTQGDFYTGYLRYYLQERFGNGGQGFVHLAEINRWYRMLDTRIDSRGFKTTHAQSRSALDVDKYGLLGARATASSATAFGRIAPRQADSTPGIPKQFELYYETHPNGGGLDITVNGQYQLRVGTRGRQAPNYFSFLLPSQWEQVVVSPVGDGVVQLYGISVENARRGVVVDTLGINGTRAANWLKWDEQLWTEHVRRREPSLVLIAYGTNETVDTKQPISIYQQKLTQVLSRLRHALPQSSCVLMGPGDFPKEASGGWIPRNRLTQIIAVQRQLAQVFGCAFWDTYAFMGGEGSMHRWHKAYPSMASKDHIHFTPRGYVKLGMALGDAIMDRFDAELNH